MDKYIRDSIADDVQFLAKNLRQEDVEEVEALGSSAFAALRRGYCSSDPCRTLLDDKDVPIAMVGIVKTHNPQLGGIWLLGTQGIETNTYKFLKYSRPALDSLFQDSTYEGFYNYAYSENHLHHKWLKWLGFTFLREVQLPPHGKSFYEFVKLRGQSNV